MTDKEFASNMQTILGITPFVSRKFTKAQEEVFEKVYKDGVRAAKFFRGENI